MSASKLPVLCGILFLSLSLAHADTSADRTAAQKLCKGDAQKLCPGKTPASGLFKCFRQNRQKLSDGCKSAMKKLREDKRAARKTDATKSGNATAGGTAPKKPGG